ncbi:MAG: hypothetical protein CMJ78_02365 [Planctomycetaceae bacterium]|nr:hypothetical protein [Planctomycetaceae bacterium]
MRDAARFFSRSCVCWLLLGLVLLSGCTQTEYRLQADGEAYSTIAERNDDPRWAAGDYSIDLDPKSRYFDKHDPDRSPMPEDDPTSNRYMRLVNGKRGWGHWGDSGQRDELENSEWRNLLAEYVEVSEEGFVRLDVNSALSLAYMHSPQHQRQLETLYLSALDVSEERFRLDTQFFGGSDLAYIHNGKLSPAILGFDENQGKFVVTPPRQGVENNRVPVGTNAEARRRFATAGELLVGFANSFVFEFTNGQANLTSSLANFSFIQPLLRGAGRDVALEQLTLDERRLLANLRAYGQFRQGFYTQVVFGELGVVGPQRGGGSTSLQSFSGFGGSVNGYLGLLQQAQEIRNTEDNLRLQLRTRDRLQALYDNELIDLVQVDQFRQNIEVTRSTLLDQQNSLQLSLDNYKAQTLGLPPDLSVEVDEELIEQFQLLPQEANAILQDLFGLQARVGDVGELVVLGVRIGQLQTRLGELPDDNDVEAVDRTFGRFLSLTEAIHRRLKGAPADVRVLDGIDPVPALTEAEAAAVKQLKARLVDGPDELLKEFAKAQAQLKGLSDGLSAETVKATVEDNIEWLKTILQFAHGLVVVQSISRDVASEPADILKRSMEVIGPVRKLFDSARKDLEAMDAAVPARTSTMREDEKLIFQKDRERLHQRFRDLEKGTPGYDESVTRLESLKGNFKEETRVETLRGLTGWVQGYLQVVERLTLVPAQARLEVITVDRVDLDEIDAFRVALTNRLDFMNGRAALVDRWRAIQVNADALQSVLNITAEGNVTTARNNPVSFRAPAANARLGLEFDAPFTRLLERNDYREALIEYQRSRRGLIQSHDSLQKGLRALLRTLEQRRLQLEIQRRAVSIALRLVDQTQLKLLTPPPQLGPGARAQINPTTALNLLNAQRSLQISQNSFLAAWLRYYVARVRLYRELGVMELDIDGRWVENPLDFDEGDPAGGLEPLPLPPALLPPPVPPGEPQTALETATPPANVDKTDEVSPVNHEVADEHLDEELPDRKDTEGRQREFRISVMPVPKKYD